MNNIQQMKELLDLAKNRKIGDSAQQEKKVIEQQEPNPTVKKENQLAIQQLDSVVDLGNGIYQSSEFYQLMRPDEDTYDTIKLTPEEVEKVKRQLRKNRTTIVQSTALICPGDKCEFQLDCPLSMLGKAPIGKQCPIELELLAQWTQQYMYEFNVDMDNFTEIGLITELAECNLFERRANLILARYCPTMTKLEVVAIDESGKPAEQEMIAKHWELKERVKNRRDKIYKQLMATRDSKVKLKAIQTTQQQTTVMQQIANIRTQLDKIQQTRKQD